MKRAAVLPGVLAIALLWILSAIPPWMAAADTPPLPGSLAAGTSVYLPLVGRQYSPPAPAPTPTPTTLPGGPVAPAQVAPAAGATLDTISPSFTIDNSAVGQPARAQLQYAPVPDMSTDLRGFSFARFQGTSTAVLDWNLNPGTTYYWRLRSSLDGVSWGPWSAVWSFTTASGGTLPEAPALISPADGGAVGSLRPAFTWSPVSGATRYAITVGGATYFSWVNQFTLSRDLDPATAYSWSVSARNGYGWGAQSNEWAFSTPSAQSISGHHQTSQVLETCEVLRLRLEPAN